LNSRLRRAFSGDLEIHRIQSLLEEARIGGVDLDATTLEYTIRKTIERLAARVRENPTDLQDLRALDEAIQLTRKLPFTVTVWVVQNIAYDLLQEYYPEMLKYSGDDEEARTWVDSFRTLAANLSLRVD
jgi:hypothetical protein